MVLPLLVRAQLGMRLHTQGHFISLSHIVRHTVFMFGFCPVTGCHICLCYVSLVAMLCALLHCLLCIVCVVCTLQYCNCYDRTELKLLCEDVQLGTSFEDNWCNPRTLSGHTSQINIEEVDEDKTDLLGV